MAATLTVIWWRDIPAQVIAKDRRQAHKIVLHPRFQVAIEAFELDFVMLEFGHVTGGADHPQAST